MYILTLVVIQCAMVMYLHSLALQPDFSPIRPELQSEWVTI